MLLCHRALQPYLYWAMPTSSRQRVWQTSKCTRPSFPSHSHRYYKHIPETGQIRFEEWARKYGPIYSLKVFNSNIIVISDPQIVSQLLDKKGVIYSDRPESAVAMYITNGHHFSFEQQGPSWKLKRAIAVRHFSPQLLDTHHFRIQEAE